MCVNVSFEKSHSLDETAKNGVDELNVGCNEVEGLLYYEVL